MNPITMDITNAKVLSTSTGTIIVETLPEVGYDGIIYLVPASPQGENFKYNKFMYINNAWERLNLPLSAVISLRNDLNAEILERTSKQGNLSNLTTSSNDCLVDAINEVDSNIEAEVVVRRNADTSLQTSINTENTRATGAERDLLTLIETERSRATTAEATLNTKVSSETTRATAAEATLQQNIESVSQRIVTPAVITFQYNSSTLSVTCDHTPTQVASMMLSNIVIAKFVVDGQATVPLGAFTSDYTIGSATVDRVRAGISSSAWTVQGTISDNTWAVNLV